MGVRSETVAEKAALHLGRFVAFFEEAYGHDRVSSVVRRASSRGPPNSTEVCVLLRFNRSLQQHGMEVLV